MDNRHAGDARDILPAGVDQIPIDLFRLGQGTIANDAILGMKH